MPLPLITRFPALAALPRLALGTFPTPIQFLALPTESLRGDLWIKRDDLTATPIGGNKIRALEFLLGAVQPGDTILTAGGEGSTHILTTASVARSLGAYTHAVRWRHSMNPTALATERQARELLEHLTTAGNPAIGLLRARLERRGNVLWIPPGGTSPLGMLGHVNAALELAAQVRSGEIPEPARIVLPVGSGGTAAGLALGLAIAGMSTSVIGVRVAPRVAAGRLRVLWLAWQLRRYLAREAGEHVRSLDQARLSIVHEWYGGAYGRVLPSAGPATRTLSRAADIDLDGTYSEKAFAAALHFARCEPGSTIFWLTYGPIRNSMTEISVTEA